MKNCFGVLFGAIILVTTVRGSEQVEYQSAGTNRYKCFSPGFTNVCSSPELYKVYRTQHRTYSWKAHQSAYSLSTNGVTYYLSYQSDFEADGDITWNCSGISNASGSATETDISFGESGPTATNTYSATMEILDYQAVFVDTSDPVAPDWIQDRFSYPSPGNPGEKALIPYDDPWWPFETDPPTVTFTQTGDTTQVLKVSGNYESDPVSGSFMSVDFTKTTTYSDEFPTVDLLDDFGGSSGWSPGYGEAAAAISGDQTTAGMFGERIRVGLVAPKGNFKIPYVITAHFNALATNFYSTNYIEGKGDNVTWRYYPCGDGIQLRPPYGTIGSGDCMTYVGGTASIAFSELSMINDGKDWPPCEKCAVCAGDNPISSQNVGSLGMPRWQVSEPYLNLWMHDTPVEYTTSLGEKIGFTMTWPIGKLHSRHSM